jgi:predicted DNA-binding transcriptional regulator AlpA
MAQSNTTAAKLKGRPRKPHTESADLGRVGATPAIPLELQNFDQLPDSAHVRLPVVQRLYGCSASAIWRNVKVGAIPAPIKLTANITAWRVGDLRSALEAAAGGAA